MYRNMWFRLRTSTSSSASSSFKSNNNAAEEKLVMSSSLGRPLSVEEEYNNALRTLSFLDIWKKAHHHLKKSVSTAVAPDTSPANELEKHSSSSFSLHYYAQLPDSLLDTTQETILAATSKSTAKCTGYRSIHKLLLEYFDITFEACIACSSLLACIDRIRTHHHTLRRLLVKFCSDRSHHSTVSEKLTAHLRGENPISPTNLGQFHRTHTLYGSLICRLTAARRRIWWRKVILKTSRYGGAAVFGVAALAALVVAVHSVVGIAFVPAAAALGPRWLRMKEGGGRTERVEVQVDAALKGAYIVGRDLDTISRMVRRLYEEVEHEREVGLMAVRNCVQRKVVREVVRGMESEESGFANQLEELEQHAYLCLLAINKSRRLLVQEMGGAKPAVMA